MTGWQQHFSANVIGTGLCINCNGIETRPLYICISICCDDDDDDYYYYYWPLAFVILTLVIILYFCTYHHYVGACLSSQKALPCLFAPWEYFKLHAPSPTLCRCLSKFAAVCLVKLENLLLFELLIKNTSTIDFLIDRRCFDIQDVFFPARSGL